jgi:hypothetical protein
MQCGPESIKSMFVLSISLDFLANRGPTDRSCPARLHGERILDVQRPPDASYRKPFAVHFTGFPRMGLGRRAGRCLSVGRQPIAADFRTQKTADPGLCLSTQ